MSTNGFHPPSADVALQWKVGLINSQGKYLTAEAFGFKINASSPTMRKKQLWTIEHNDGPEDVVYIRSHLGRYLIAEKKGPIRGDAEDNSDDCSKFTIEYHPDGSGRWAFKNKGNSYYFGGTDDNLQCYEKAPKETEWWTVRLDIHPHVNLRNANRKTYGKYNEQNDKIQFDALIPWGVNSLLRLHFQDGKYGVQTYEKKFLHWNGDLVATCSKDTLFTLEIHSGALNGMSLRDSNGKYLSPVGREATMQARNKSVTKDELFILEDSHPQVEIKAHNGKKVSTKQGVDLTANQIECGEMETFQVEYDSASKGWRFRTCGNKYWSLEQSQGIQAIGNSRSGTGVFFLEYKEDGSVAIKASNGRYITARMNGALYADKDSVTEKEIFIMFVVNRPLIVLKTEFGFVGAKTTTNPRVECNKMQMVTLNFENGPEAQYYFKGNNGKYWNTDSEGNINADSDTPQPFICVFSSQSKFTIKAPNGKWIKAEQNGSFCAKVDEDKAFEFEY